MSDRGKTSDAGPTTGGTSDAGPTTGVTLGITTSHAIEAAVLVGERCTALGGAGQALDTVLARVRQALAGAGMRLDDVALLAVCVGPGSFTGLRIGVSFAKSVAQARELPLVGVTTYDVVERRVGDADVAVVSGKRGFYYARVRRGGDVRLVAGDADALAAAGIALPAEPPLPDGAAAQRVAQIGRRLYAAGAPADWRELALEYGQRPTAETNWRRLHERGVATKRQVRGPRET